MTRFLDETANLFVMTIERRWRQLAWSAVIVAWAVIIWAGAQMSPERAYDDAFITYRYAANLRDGLGLVYNPGEWVLGTTAPLYALLLGMLGKTGVMLPTLGHVIGVAAWAVTALFAAALLWNDSAENPIRRFLPAALAPLLIAVQPALWNSLGMEAALVVALMLVSAVSWLRGHRVVAVVALAALILVRQDGALWALVLGLEMWRREKRLPWREGLVVVLLTLPWFVYAQWRYGSFLPNSIAAKVGQNELMAVTEANVFGAFVRNFWQTVTVGSILIALLFALLLLLSVVAVRRRRQFGWLWVWLIGYLLVYSILDVATFPWYFVPPVVIACLLAALGCGELAPLWDRSFGRIAFALPVILIVSLGANLVAQVQAQPERYRPAYRAAAAWLASETRPTDAVAAIEIGALGFFSNRPIVDTMGLVTPALTVRQFGWGETLVYAINALQPDYAVVLPETAWDGIVGQPWFEAQYAPVATFDDVSIYRRQEVPQPAHVITPNFPFAEGIILRQIAYDGQRLETTDTLQLDLTVDVTADQSQSLYFDLFLADAQTFERFAPTAVMPFAGGYGTQFWRAGDRFVVPAELTVPASLNDGVYQIGVGLNGQDVLAGWLRYGDPPVLEPVVTDAEDIAWLDGPVLLGLDPAETTVQPGTTATFTVSWRLPEAQTRDLKTFYHLVDESGTIVAQRDQRPVNGRWPLPVWQAGEEVTEVVSIVLPADVPPGKYDLNIGWYDAAGRLLLEEDSADRVQVEQALTVIAK
ncbi:MAG: hypothetical protein M9918_14980 [Anaerolineae bacterium]|nr:hypothetical protein [Anaerolineae bacterium]